MVWLGTSEQTYISPNSFIRYSLYCLFMISEMAKVVICWVSLEF